MHPLWGCSFQSLKTLSIALTCTIIIWKLTSVCPLKTWYIAATFMLLFFCLSMLNPGLTIIATLLQNMIELIRYTNPSGYYCYQYRPLSLGDLNIIKRLIWFRNIILLSVTRWKCTVLRKKKSLGETLSTKYMSDVQYVECMLTFFILGWHSKILPVCNRTLAEPPLSLEAEKYYKL